MMKRNLGWVFLAIAAFNILWARFAHFWFHPEWTEMQAFQVLWIHWVMAVFSLIIALCYRPSD